VFSGKARLMLGNRSQSAALCCGEEEETKLSL
jgi:hypothetical protein